MDAWSYYTLIVKNTAVHQLDAKLNTLGADGWELTASLTTVKTWVNVTGNDLVLVFKKRGTNAQPATETIAAVLGIDADQGAWG